MQALIAASSVLQRERTALKLMLTLLVKKRDELRLGQLIPVGDLWDEIATGDQPFSDGLRIQFDNAKKLWNQKLQPLLEQEHRVTWQELQDDRADPQVRRRFENDARLLKTLLLSALVPEVPALRALTAPRLAALNHGSVISPVPGGEGAIVLQKLRSWATRVGEIRVSDDQVPTISLQISGVDVEPILANAAQADNDGTRRSKLQRVLFDMLGIAADNTLFSAQPFHAYEHLWRGTRREVDLYFEVIRELGYDRLRGRGAPVLVLGMPFDPKGRPPADHLAHARNFNDENASGGIVWQPSNLSDRAMKDLGTLVRIDFLLAGAGDRLTEAARHLSASDREQARAILRSQQSALHQRVRACLETAYGIRPDNDGCLGTTVEADERLVSLDGTFRPQTPVGADMKSAVSALLDRFFEHRFPAHPEFEGEVRDAMLRRVLERIQQAAGEPNQRVLIEDHADRRHLSVYGSAILFDLFAGKGLLYAFSNQDSERVFSWIMYSLSNYGLAIVAVLAVRFVIWRVTDTCDRSYLLTYCWTFVVACAMGALGLTLATKLNGVGSVTDLSYIRTFTTMLQWSVGPGLVAVCITYFMDRQLSSDLPDIDTSIVVRRIVNSVAFSCFTIVLQLPPLLALQAQEDAAWGSSKLRCVAVGATFVITLSLALMSQFGLKISPKRSLMPAAQPAE